MRDEVFQLDQAGQVQLELRVAQLDRLAQGAAAEAHIGALDALALALGRDMPVDQLQQAPRLRRQFVEAAAEHIMGDAVGEFDVGQRDFDVLDDLPIAVTCTLRALHFPLMLMRKAMVSISVRYFS